MGKNWYVLLCSIWEIDDLADLSAHAKGTYPLKYACIWINCCATFKLNQWQKTSQLVSKLHLHDHTRSTNSNNTVPWTYIKSDTNIDKIKLDR